MKKIGILFGQENSFPQAFVERINSKAEKNISAELVSINIVNQAEYSGYDVIVDRISQDVPFYRAYLKNAALCGTTVINNPFWWSADEKFFNNALATKIGVAVPKTVLLPSHQVPTDTNDNSFRNLAYPLNWEAMFEYVGWPAKRASTAGSRSGVTSTARLARIVDDALVAHDVRPPGRAASPSGWPRARRRRCAPLAP